MDNTKIARIGGYVSLTIMIAAAAIFLLASDRFADPAFIALPIASWLHGIFWGYRYAREGRLTWL